jgi:excisionase family DNA binding protein
MNVRISEPKLRPFFTPKTLAAYLAVSERTARQLLADGRIPSYRIAGARRIDPADVDAYLAANRDRGYSGPRT